MMKSLFSINPTRVSSAILLVASMALFAFSEMRKQNEQSPEKFARSFDYNFTIKTLDGTKIDFNTYRNKVVFINVWATWCAPCRAEMPYIQNLYKDVGSDVSFVMLSLDPDQDLAKVNKYINSKQFTFPVFMPSGTLTKQLDVDYVPTTFILDKTGKIAFKYEGGFDYSSPRIKNLLKKITARPDSK